MIWRSVVGKLWATILLFFSFVLFILTLLLMQFLNNYLVNQVTNTLTNTAAKIAVILEQHDDLHFGLEVAWEILDDVTKVIIVTDENHMYYSSTTDANHFDLSYFTEDKELSRVFSENEVVKKDILLPDNGDKDNKQKEEALMIGVPLEKFSNKKGAVFIYQSLDVMKETTTTTTRLIWGAAFIAFVLTTVFAFFLSTRISSPLIKMREVAFEVANGEFDTKVPILTNDEIGELATAFNQMRKRLKVNMNALNQEKEQLSSILSSMADGVFMFNRDGKIIVKNPPAERFLHHWYYEQENVQLDVVPTKVLELFHQAIEGKKEQIGDISLQGRYWSVIVSPLYNNEKIRGAVAVLRDMTEEREMDKLRKDFVANVSHELRTPIAMLQGYSEALMDDVASSEEERKEIATVINEESLRMGRLVNELLDLARMESGHLRLREEIVMVQPFMEKIVKKFAGLAKDNQLELQLALHLNEVEWEFDPDRMEQVLTNLIDNAIRHTGEGGLVEVNARNSHNSLIIEVKDNGTGIPSEDLPFVFERFYKADKARTRGKSGTGLGLAIAKNIVDSHHGSIDVRSKLGQGTTFTILIPRKS
ncbi:cell wall metabolism sensor histidine kinase WalK [Caldibacillus lycopersici]|uniref:histidine kinase n=1 Tax=Perspicuibacillus lycopersici TaxID=1325689 RepID=A0AAE3ISD3_9BACI|nr:cell wall metabolism sensor histidine kinase WalK [Perspicuibacillus lycopersici]MCU9613745.1 cell wall metabolism sensor histidine kinase WalK [Perspicuibacillus lycopersici]